MFVTKSTIGLLGALLAAVGGCVNARSSPKPVQQRSKLTRQEDIRKLRQPNQHIEKSAFEESERNTIADVKIIRLMTDINFPEDRKIIQQVLKAAGFEVVDKDAFSYDATLQAEIERKAFGAKYTDGAFHYTTAATTGCIRFVLEGTVLYSHSVSDETGTPKGVLRGDEEILSSLSEEGLFRRYWIDLRRDVLYVLGCVGRMDAVAMALEDKSVATRQAAAKALGEIADSRAIESLIRALDDADADVRRYATEALIRITEQKAVERLLKALGDKKRIVGIDADTAKALGKMADLGGVELALEALGDTSQLARIVEPLIKALDDEDWIVRSSAAEGLANIADPRAVQPLLKALGDKNSTVRMDAARALGEIGDESAVPALEGLLSDESISVRKVVEEALAKIEAKVKEQN